MRLVASPFLSPSDIDAIKSGYAQREELITRSLSNVVSEIESFAETSDYPTEILTWLIAHDRLAIKIAFPTRVAAGIYHEKIGIIKDGFDAIAFTGSFNETGAAASTNFESIDVFTSWADARRVANKISDFETLWGNATEGLEVMAFPEALRARLIAVSPKSMPPPPSFDQPEAEAKTITLREYQEEALLQWRKNGRRGIFEMATGTGKTKTAISAIRDGIDNGARSVVVLAPLKHLADDWANQLSDAAVPVVIRCSSDYSWRQEIILAASRARLDTAGAPLVIASTYATAQTVDFASSVAGLPKPIMLVADEVHNITSESSSEILREVYSMRLGLSATPERYNDADGTNVLYDFFGGVVFRFDIAKAIALGFLTPYDYFPIFCSLTDVELLEYELIKHQLHEISMEPKQGSRRNRVTEILKQRESLIQTAADKIKQFEELIAAGSFDDEGFNLVYCHPRFISVVQDFLGKECRFRTHTFTAQESLRERTDILKRFANGDLRFLTAIRCLDEGVDVPATRTAFLLNSSQNPKEFIQRRGRVLRLYPGKTAARIYDFIVLPERVDERDESLVRRELTRFNEFAANARNRDDAVGLLQKKSREIGISLI
jgi:superfamily II DNA or RNA helicase